MQLRHLARGLIILYLLLFLLLSFDSTGVGVLMHNIPTLLLLGVFILSFYEEKIAGIFFLICSVVATLFFRTYQDIVVFLLITAPLVLSGVLFLFGSKNIFLNENKSNKK